MKFSKQLILLLVITGCARSTPSWDRGVPDEGKITVTTKWYQGPPRNLVAQKTYTDDLLVEVYLSFDPISRGMDEVILAQSKVGSLDAQKEFDHKVSFNFSTLKAGMKSLGVKNIGDKNLYIRIDYIEITGFSNSRTLLVTEAIPLEEALAARNKEYTHSFGRGGALSNQTVLKNGTAHREDLSNIYSLTYSIDSKR
jgi:hypothetical protein